MSTRKQNSHYNSFDSEDENLWNGWYSSSLEPFFPFHDFKYENISKLYQNIFVSDIYRMFFISIFTFQSKVEADIKYQHKNRIGIEIVLTRKTKMFGTPTGILTHGAVFSIPRFQVREYLRILSKIIKQWKNIELFLMTPCPFLFNHRREIFLRVKI